MLDETKIGTKFEPRYFDIEKGALRAFAKAIGEVNPIYSNEAKAKEAGHRSIPALPTYAFSLMGFNMEEPANENFMTVLGLTTIQNMLHTNQSFEYSRPIYAGDRLRGVESIHKIFDKKEGAFTFIELKCNYSNQNDEHVLSVLTTYLIQNNMKVDQ